jgi:hypothetical protein
MQNASNDDGMKWISYRNLATNYSNHAKHHQTVPHAILPLALPQVPPSLKVMSSSPMQMQNVKRIVQERKMKMKRSEK